MINAFSKMSFTTCMQGSLIFRVWSFEFFHLSIFLFPVSFRSLKRRRRYVTCTNPSRRTKPCRRKRKIVICSKCSLVIPTSTLLKCDAGTAPPTSTITTTNQSPYIFSFFFFRLTLSVDFSFANALSHIIQNLLFLLMIVHIIMLA